MYMEKKFRIRPLEEVLEDLLMARRHYRRVDRIFLADGDALICRTEDLVSILDTIARLFPECERVTSYAGVRCIQRKTTEELRLLHEKGLDMVYLGLESGSDRVLTKISKGCTAQDNIDAAKKLKEAGIKLSVTEITGLDGPDGMYEHATQTARVLSEMNPEYIGIVTLTLRRGSEMLRQYEAGEFKRLTPRQIVEEMKLMIEHLDSEGSIVRSNHISNYVNVRGTMNRDKGRMLQELEDALRMKELDNPYTEYLENI